MFVMVREGGCLHLGGGTGRWGACGILVIVGTGVVVALLVGQAVSLVEVGIAVVELAVVTATVGIAVLAGMSVVLLMELGLLVSCDCASDGVVVENVGD